MGICERCGKAQATFHLTNIDEAGDKLERHLCDSCATEEGLLHTQKPTVDINEIIENFISGSKSGSADLSSLVCENCGISYVEFRNQGLLGCAKDYDAFKEQIDRLLNRTHAGATAHVGKSPQSLGAAHKPQQDLWRLKRQLDEAITAEDYERAAELRDRIRALEEE